MSESKNTTDSLKSQVAFVTGGGRGIGQAISLELAKRGAVVAVVGRTMDTLQKTVSMIEADGGTAGAWVADVTNQSDIDRIVEEVERELGPISLLVNNAGTNKGGGPLWLVDPDEWWDAMEINLRGPFLCTRAVLPGMLQRANGRIVNIGSLVGARPEANASSYSVAKAALMRLTDCAAMGVAAQNVQVFAISPGWVWTDMTRDTVELIKANDPNFEGIDEEYVFEPEDTASLIARLAGGEADALTGRFIHVGNDLAKMIEDADQIVDADRYALRLVE